MSAEDRLGNGSGVWMSADATSAEQLFGAGTPKDEFTTAIIRFCSDENFRVIYNLTPSGRRVRFTMDEQVVDGAIKFYDDFVQKHGGKRFVHYLIYESPSALADEVLPLVQGLPAESNENVVLFMGILKDRSI
ncbi:MAG TPA: hypothetical protein VLF68_00620, partial [Candidatus Saccharimonadales bacterium]|nr:hypothetical protein [Candidatus Saccharimonadales bacterium]